MGSFFHTEYQETPLPRAAFNAMKARDKAEQDIFKFKQNFLVATRKPMSEDEAHEYAIKYLWAKEGDRYNCPAVAVPVTKNGKDVCGWSFTMTDRYGD